VSPAVWIVAPQEAEVPLPLMTKISCVAILTAAEGKEAELADRLTDLIAAAADETGTEIYSVHTDPDDPMIFTFFELYTDQEAVEVHGKSDAMRQAMRALGGLLAGRPEIRHLTPLAAKGLDL